MARSFADNKLCDADETMNGMDPHYAACLLVPARKSVSDVGSTLNPPMNNCEHCFLAERGCP